MQLIFESLILENTNLCLQCSEEHTFKLAFTLVRDAFKDSTVFLRSESHFPAIHYLIYLSKLFT